MQQQVAVVTGGNRGIGRAVADGLARAGLSVVLTAPRAAEAAAAAAALSTPDQPVRGLPLDVTDSQSLRRFLGKTEVDFPGGFSTTHATPFMTGVAI